MTQLTPIVVAESDLNSARQHEAQLRDAVVAGDVAVTGAELAAAEAEVRVAAMRLDAVRQTETENAERDRLARIKAIRSEAAASGDYTDILDAFDLAVEVVTDLVESIESNNAALRQAAHDLSTLGDRGDVRSQINVSQILAEAIVVASRAGGIDPPGVFQQAAFMTTDRTTAELYGVPAREDGAQQSFGITARLRWLTGQLANNR